jgi:hypothetical protein
MKIESTTPKQKTVWVKGETLVGLDNPCDNPNVRRAKELCAELANLLNHPAPFMKDELTSTYEALYKEAMVDILKAEVMVTKLLTLKEN